MPSRKRVVIISSITISFFLLILVGSNLFLKKNMDKIRSVASEYVERNSDFRLAITKVHVNLFSSVSLDGIRLDHKVKPFSATADAVVIHYRIWDLITRKVNLIDSISHADVNSLTIRSSGLSVKELQGLFVSGSKGSPLPAFPINFINSRVIIDIGSSSLKGNIQSFLFDPSDESLWKARLNSRIYFSSLALKWDTDVRSEFRWNRQTKKWDCESQLLNGFFNKERLTDFNLRLDGTPNGLIRSSVNSGKIIVSSFQISNNGKFSLKTSFQGFDLSPFIRTAYKLTGQMNITGSRSFPILDISFSAVSFDSKKIFRCHVSKNALVDLHFMDSGKERFIFAKDKSDHSYSGSLKDSSFGNHTLNGFFIFNTTPDVDYFQINSLDLDKTRLLKKYSISIQKSPGTFTVRSVDGRLNAFLSFIKPASSYCSLDLTDIAFTDPGSHESWTANGIVFLNSDKFTLNNGSFKMNNLQMISSMEGVYRISTQTADFLLKSGTQPIIWKGKLSGIEDSWSLDSLLSIASSSYQLKGICEKAQSRWHFEFNLGGFLDLSGMMQDSMDLRAKFVLGQNAASPWKGLSGTGLLTGNLNQLSTLKATSDLHYQELRYGPFIVPHSSFHFETSLRKDISFRGDMAGRNGKTIKSVGTMNWKGELTYCVVDMDPAGTIIRYDIRNGGRNVSFNLKNFDLTLLMPFMNPKLVSKLDGYLSFELFRSGNNSVSLWAFLDNVRCNDVTISEGRLTGKSRMDGFFLQKGIFKYSMAQGKGELNFHDGLIRSVGTNLIFTSMLDFNYSNKGTDLSGMIDVTGKNSPSAVNFKLGFFKLRIGQNEIPKFEQYIRWSKSISHLELYSDTTGIDGVLSFRKRPSFGLATADIVYKADKKKLFVVKGDIDPQQQLKFQIKDISIPLTYARYFTHIVKQADGLVTGGLELKGTLTNIQIFGNLVMTEGQVKLNEVIREMDHINGTIKFFGDSFSTEDFAGLIEKNPVMMTAEADLDGRTIGNYNINISTLTNGYIYIKILNDIQGYVVGKCNFAKIGKEPLITGDLRIKNIDFTFPLSISLGKKNNDSSPAPILDLTIHAMNNVNYFQNMNNIKIPLDPGSYIHIRMLAAARPSDEDQVIGVLSAQKGKIDYLGSTFTVRKVRLVFAEEYARLSPYIDFTSDMKTKNGTQDVTIYLEGSGLLDNDFSPKVYSSPALTQREIVKLLGFGQLYDKVLVKNQSTENEVNLNTSSDQELNGLFLAGILTYFDQTYQNVLIRPAERRIKKFLKLDKFEISPGLGGNIIEKGLKLAGNSTNKILLNPLATGLNNTSIVVGKYLTDFLFLEYMMNLQGIEQDSFANYYYQQQYRLELDLKSVLFEWKFQPSSSKDTSQDNKNVIEYEIKWQKSF